MVKIVSGVGSFIGVAVLAACSSGPGLPVVEAASPWPTIASPKGTARPPFKFERTDDELLAEVSRGAFNFLWKEVNATGMAPDRSSKPNLVSVAGVGFQLTAFCVGAERGWVTKDAAAERALRIVRALAKETSNRKDGMFYHFIDGATGGFPKATPEDAVSTVDSALLFAGLLTAGEYFKDAGGGAGGVGGEIREIADRLYAEANWRAYVLKDVVDYERDVIALAWAPTDPAKPSGAGKLKPYGWVDSGDEHRLVTFLAVAAPNEAYRVDASMYYRLRRPLGTHQGVPMVYLPWSGAHFVNIFAHCWIDYAGRGPDNPAAFGHERRASVDWWENSRRQTGLHRDKAIAATGKLPNLGPNSWGLTASDCPSGYCVPGVYPKPLRLADERVEWDHPKFAPKDDLGDGTVAPYGAGASVMFEPELGVAALRAMRGIPGVWRDPAAGGFGLADAYNVPKGWVASDDLAIDQGPLLVGIENARSGLIWGVFERHEWVAAGTRRLGWEKAR